MIIGVPLYQNSDIGRVRFFQLSFSNLIKMLEIKVCGDLLQHASHRLKDREPKLQWHLV
jgi:hypothetical protein